MEMGDELWSSPTSERSEEEDGLFDIEVDEVAAHSKCCLKWVSLLQCRGLAKFPFNKRPPEYG